MASQQKVMFTIAQGAQDSNSIGGDQLRNARSMIIIAPDTLTGTVTAQCGDKLPYEVEAASIAYADIQSPPGTDVTIEAGKATVFTVVPFPAFRLHSSIPEASARTFTAFVIVGE